MKRNIGVILGIVLLCVPGLTSAQDEKGYIECTMEFSLKGWSAIYKTASGEGVIKCNNGQKAAVTLEARGGGLTVGKTEIDEGVGNFSDVRDISECFGTYAQAEAHAGAGKSADATAMTKGPVSLALAGKGRGVDLGIAFGAFIIEKKGAKKDDGD